MPRKLVAGVAIILIAAAYQTTRTDVSAQVREKTVSFETEDGVNLGGILFGEGKNFVILSHMRPDTQKDWRFLAVELAAKGYSALTYDFRGYPASGGGQDFKKLDLDLEAAVAYAREQGAEKIVLIGASMGAMATAKVASREAVAGAVIMSAYWGGGRWLKTSEAEIKAITAPLLFINSKGDDSFRDTHSMYEVATAPKEEKIFAGKDHGRRICTNKKYKEECEQIIFTFLETYAPVP